MGFPRKEGRFDNLKKYFTIGKDYFDNLDEPTRRRLKLLINNGYSYSEAFRLLGIKMGS